MAEQILVLPFVFLQCPFWKIRGAIQANLGEIDDKWRLLHQVRLSDHQFVIEADPLRNPEVAKFFRYTIIRQALIGVALVEVADAPLEGLDRCAVIGCPHNAIGPVAKAFFEIYPVAD